MINKKLYWVLFFLGFSCFLWAQSEGSKMFSINSIKIDEKTKLLDVLMSVPSDSENRVNANNMKFVELLPDGTTCKFRIVQFLENIPDNIKSDTVTILFLLDYSGSMNVNNRLSRSKATISKVVSKIRLLKGSTFNLSIFNDDITKSIKLNKVNVDKILTKYPKATGDTDLYRAIFEKLAELSRIKGRKVLVLLSDGQDDTRNNPYYNKLGNKRIDAKKVIEKIKLMDLTHDLLIMTYGIGDGVDREFLKSLPEITEARDDDSFFTQNIDEITDNLMDKLSVYSSDYLFKLKPQCKEYRGELRQLGVRWTKKNKTYLSDAQDYKFGSAIEPIILENTASGVENWFVFLALGIFLVFGLLMLMIYFVPIIRKREFRRKFVKKFVPEENKIKRDPVTQDIFKEGDLVVTKCNQMTSLNTWEALGHCPNFPNCMEFQNACNGSGGEEMSSSFFSQKGKMKIYNWMWFGALGGLIGWILYTGLLEWWQLDGLAMKMQSWFPSLNPEISAGDNYLDEVSVNAVTFVEQAFQGGLLGTSLISTLTVAEELGQTRNISYGRIAIRILLAVISSFLLFSSGFFFQYHVLNNVFLSGLINWSTYGLILGIILSLSSSIEWKKGILGGLIACIISYLAYYGIGFLITNDLLAKLISFLLVGGLLGALIVTVLSNLENFELIFLSPQEYNGMVKPISKWLKSGMDVFIGTSSKCYVFIKWTDNAVEDKHAKLVFNDGAVYIMALYETQINGVTIPENQKILLENGDIIQLGRNSISKMQYKEKRN